MKKLFILKASGSHGKSSTLISLARKLRENHTSVVLIDELYPNGYDEFLIVQLGSIRVAVITEGDRVGEEDIAVSLKRCSILDVNVIFAASWNSGIVYDLINDFSNMRGYTIIEASPLYCENSNKTMISRLNDAESDLLLSVITI